MKYFFLSLLVLVELAAGVREINIKPEKARLSKIRILDQKELNYSMINGQKFSEISDIAYLPSKEKLFMISDKGVLFVFRARFGKKIEFLKPIEAAVLRKKGGRSFKKWRKDSEGLTLDGKARLLVSFEGKAKIGWFHKNSEKIGERIRRYALPKILQKTSHYRSRNKSLEALAWHPKYGVLTAAEWPLKRDNKKRQTIYGMHGKRWHFKAEPEGRSGLVAMAVMDDGNLIVLERSYTGLFDPFVVTLKKIYLDACHNGWCRTEVLVKMDSHEGWDVDNFEGLARVGKERYVMVSDDNDNFFQRTLLIYFEVKQ